MASHGAALAGSREHAGEKPSFRGADKNKLESARALAQANEVIKRLRLITGAAAAKRSKPARVIPGTRPRSPTLFKGVEVCSWACGCGRLDVSGWC